MSLPTNLILEDKKNMSSKDSTTFLSLIISVLLVSVMIIFLIWLLLRVVGIRVDFWTAAVALASIGSMAAFFGGGYYASRQLKELSNSRHLQIADKLFEELNSEENIAARRWVFQSLPADPEEGMRTLTEEGQIAVKRVLNSLDQVAFLTQAGWIPENLIMPWMHPMIAKSWEKLEPYVELERQRRNEPYYYKHASLLAYRCKAWRIKNLEDSQVKWVDKAL